ncbi:hypothetical protein DFA_06686 [Cavenderia fasciculata]|uniref:Uncharacterized protein n=1 Tax=Cavenderia fasciculata TaxID=261658 RepID=F4Q200_CACFS|nr:uncharacterized protein DFA_06686 [Cavenderia fasciculata]EGG18020.1 hypothetical protein DFA_06686 [Cavenderia fasciculata]|eukprot:XP_004356913.1 hypothetical protein DFA_06686 [Cavenderia fasciculata]
MEEPSEDFIEIVVILAKEEEQNRLIPSYDRPRSLAKQRFKQCASTDKVALVSWLLFLMIKGTYPTIQDKAIRLLDRLIRKGGKEFIVSLPQPIVQAINVETQELLSSCKEQSCTDNFVYYSFDIMQALSQNQGDQEEEEEYKDMAATKSFHPKKYLTFCCMWPQSLPVMHLTIPITTLKESLGLHKSRIVGHQRRRRSGQRTTPRLTLTMSTFTHTNFQKKFNKPINGYNEENYNDDDNQDEYDDDDDEEDSDSDSDSDKDSDDENKKKKRKTRDDDDDDDDDNDMYEEKGDIQTYSIFQQFAKVCGKHFEGPIFKQFNSLSNNNNNNSKKSYLALMSFSQSCRSNKFIRNSITKQFPTILKLVLKFIDDENIRVRWASLQCLIQLSLFRVLMIDEQLFADAALGKSIHDPNECIQSRYCILVKIMTTRPMMSAIGLDGLFNWFEILLGSSILNVVENTFLSLISVIETTHWQSQPSGFKPYYDKIVPILFSLLGKYIEQEKESKVLTYVIKTFAMCGTALVDVKKTLFSKDLYKFMVFVKKNETKSFDLVVQLFNQTDSFIKSIGKSFAMYLPMVVKMIANILERPLPNRGRDVTPHLKKAMPTLKGLRTIMMNGSVYEPLAPFVVHSLVGPLLKLAIHPWFQIDSLHCLLGCLALSKLHFGVRSEKTLELFAKIYDSVLCIGPEREIADRITIATCLIKTMETDAMSIDQVQATLDVFCKVEKLEQQSGTFSDNSLFEGVLEMISQMIELNSVVASPLIASNILDTLCKKLLCTTNRRAKKVIIVFMNQYCMFGGDVAVDTFPQIIPTLIQCLTQSDDIDNVIRYTASFALATAAQFSKDRFVPWVTDVLQAFDPIMSVPKTPFCIHGLEELPISSIGRIIRYVPLATSQLLAVIPKWINNLLVTEFRGMGFVDNFCAIIRLYTNECLESFEKNWDSIPPATRKTISDCH